MKVVKWIFGEVTAPGLQQEKIVKRPKCPHQPWQNRFDLWLHMALRLW